jgi:hypothetical protein
MKLKKEIIMFKKTIIAASLLGLASTGSASTITVAAPAVKSDQGILTSVGVAGASFVVETEVAITSGSTVQVAYNKAPTNPSAVSAAVAACGGTPTVTYAGATSGGTVLNYTVNNTAANLPIACSLTFGAVANKAPSFAKADVVAGAITASASWTVVGTGVDPVAAPKTIVSMLGKDQFGLVVATKANATVDVEAARKAYTNAETADTIVLTYKDFGGGATDTKSVITVTGDFSWADDPQTAAFDVGVRRGQTPIAVAGWALGDGTTAPKPTATTLSLYKATPADGEQATITFTPLVTAGTGTVAITDDHAAVSLPNDSFSVSQVTSFTDEVAAPNTGSGTQSVASASAGAWSLNGASVKVFSVPFGSEVESHSIFVSNKGATTGAISGSVAWNGNAPVSIDLGNVQANANKYLNVMAALEGIGAKPPFGRADITFTVNSPAADITFTAGYTTAAGRANLYMEEQANLSGISNAAKTSSAAAATSSAAGATSAAASATSAAAAATDAAAAHAAVDVTCANLAAGADADGNAGGDVTAASTKYIATACP